MPLFSYIRPIGCSVMPAAIAFAVRLAAPQRLLFESIAYLQVRNDNNEFVDFAVLIGFVPAVRE